MCITNIVTSKKWSSHFIERKQGLLFWYCMNSSFRPAHRRTDEEVIDSLSATDTDKVCIILLI